VSEEPRGPAAKLKAIRALWLTGHNQTDEIEPIALEFFFALGELLEGHPPEQLALSKIDRNNFLKELRDE